MKDNLIFLWVTATTALCLGLLSNQFRDVPLPLIYQPKQERLQHAVERLTSAPAPASSAPAPASSAPAQAEKLPELLSLDEFSSFVEAKTGLVLDARPEIFHRLGHVPGAISLPRDDFENAYKALREQLEADKSQPLVLYCASPSCEDSELVKTSLQALGFTQIGIFKGGWSDWQTAGKPEASGL